MASVLADTHALVWYLQGSVRLSSNAKDAMAAALHQGSPILVSAISIVELVYLTEKRRIDATIFPRVVSMIRDVASGVVAVPLESEIAAATMLISRETVPDLPDRLIAATALRLNIPLVSRDSRISRLPNIRVVW